MTDDELDTSLDNPLIQMCIKAPESRLVRAHGVGSDNGGKGVLLKFRMITDETETVFVAAPGVPMLLKQLEKQLSAIGSKDPGMIEVKETDGSWAPYDKARPLITAEDWKVNAQDGKTISVHGDLVIMLNAAFLVFTIYKGAHRLFRLDHAHCYYLIEDLRAALSMMKLPQKSSPSSLRH